MKINLTKTRAAVIGTALLVVLGGTPVEASDYGTGRRLSSYQKKEIASKIERLRRENERLRLKLGLSTKARKHAAAKSKSKKATTVYRTSRGTIIVRTSTIRSVAPLLTYRRYGHPPKRLREIRPRSPYRNSRWTSGCWIWGNRRYTWRRGYWTNLTPIRLVNYNTRYRTRYPILPVRRSYTRVRLPSRSCRQSGVRRSRRAYPVFRSRVFRSRPTTTFILRIR